MSSQRNGQDSQTIVAFGRKTPKRPQSANVNNGTRSTISYVHSTAGGAPALPRPHSASQRPLSAGSLVYELESVKDALYYQHELAEAAAGRIRAFEQERGDLNRDADHRIKNLEAQIEEGNKHLLDTNIKIQNREAELGKILAREQELLEQCADLKHVLHKEKTASERVKSEYQLQGSELKSILADHSTRVGGIEREMQATAEEATGLKRELVNLQQDIRLLRESKRVPPLSADKDMKGAGTVASGEGASERFFFRLQIGDLLSHVNTAEARTSQIVRMQRMVEQKLMQLRKIFRFYSFFGEVSADNPFTITGLQFEQLLNDTGIVIDPVNLTKCFLQLAMADEAKDRRRKKGSQNKKLSETPSMIGSSKKGGSSVTSGNSEKFSIKKDEVHKVRFQISTCEMDFDSFLELLVRLAFRLFDQTIARRAPQLGKRGGTVVAPPTPIATPKPTNPAGAGPGGDENGPSPEDPLGLDGDSAGCVGGGGGNSHVAESSDVCLNFERLLNDHIFPKARVLEPDVDFMRAYDDVKVRAMLREHRPRMDYNFQLALQASKLKSSEKGLMEETPQSISSGSSGLHNPTQELVCSSWLGFCEQRKLLHGDKMPVARAALVFVEVYDQDYLQMLAEEAVDLRAIKGIAMGTMKKPGRRPNFVKESGFDECISRVAWAYFVKERHQMSLAEMLESFIEEMLEVPKPGAIVKKSPGISFDQ